MIDGDFNERRPHFCNFHLLLFIRQLLGILKMNAITLYKLHLKFHYELTVFFFSVKQIRVVEFRSTSSVSSWFIIEFPDDLRGTLWELKDSEVSFESCADGFWEHVLTDALGSTSDDVPLGQGASITFTKHSADVYGYILKSSFCLKYACFKEETKRRMQRF